MLLYLQRQGHLLGHEVHIPGLGCCLGRYCFCLLLAQSLLGFFIPLCQLGCHDSIHMFLHLPVPVHLQLMLALSALHLELQDFLLPGFTLCIKFFLLGPRVVHLLLIIQLQIQVQDGIEIFVIESRPLCLISGLGLFPIFLLNGLAFSLQLHSGPYDSLGIFLPDRILERLAISLRRLHSEHRQCLQVV